MFRPASSPNGVDRPTSCTGLSRRCLSFVLLAPLLLSADVPSEVGFDRLDGSAIGIDFPGSKARTSFDSTQYIENAGVAAGDVNGDGWVDLFFCGLLGPSELYLNQGDWKFRAANEQLNHALEGKYLNAATFVDVDGDRDLDLLCGSLKGDDVLLINDGTGNFSPSDQISWATSSIGGVTGFALADIDNDGDIDIYTPRYLHTIARDQQTLAEVREFTHGEIDKLIAGEEPSEEFTARYTVVVDESSGKPLHAVYENGLHDVLYLNDGLGNFTPASHRFHDSQGNPLQRLPEDWGLTATFRDADNDGDPDLYICNDFNSPDRFWINDGTGHFQPASPRALRRTSNSSMGVDFADINNDGHVDFFAVDMLSRSHSLRKRQMGEMAPIRSDIGDITNQPQIMQNTLFLNRGDNTWTEIAQYAGLKASEWSWSPAFVDVDLDGWDDVIITTGSIRDFTDADVIAEINARGELTPLEWRERQALLPPLPQRNFIFRNQGNLKFEDTSSAWGFAHEGVSGGMAWADLDNDADLDLIINNTESLPEIYRNNATADRIAIRLVGPPENTQGIGAKVTLSGARGEQWIREITAGGTYASGSDTVTVFALPHATKTATYEISVQWRDGKQTHQKVSDSGSTLPIDYADAVTVSAPPAPPASSPLFIDRSHALQHRHHEDAFDDFAEQPLLPNRLSQMGPGVTWMDLDADGDDELLVPSGKGGALTILANLGDGEFSPFKSISAVADQTTVLGHLTPDSTAFILGMSNHEHPQTPPALPFALNRSSGWETGPALPPEADATGPLAQADIDQDGDLDLLVGGRFVRTQYPRPASTRVYRNESGTLRLEADWSASFSEVGLVSAATFGDLDNDGDQDVVLALEWGPIKVFEFDNGTFVDRTTAWGLDAHLGWWNGVALGDLNNDGILEIIASNWGQNSKYEGSYGTKKGPLEIYYGDIDGNGIKDIIEAHYDHELGATVPERGFSCSSRAIPFVREKMETFANFGLASLDDIYGDSLEETEKLQANTLQHTVFYREGDSYRSSPLPTYAQLAPAFGICVGDMDGDGNDDLFLSQNFFATQSETPRNDGGRGLWLRGDGKGTLTPVRGHDSGVMVYGEQRGAALSDFDRDGRIDLAVAQNGAETKLFHNQGAAPGLRVRLLGPPENPAAIGSMMQLEFGQGSGPMRSVSAGSGYWSQESSVHVFGLPSTPTSITVQWPDGIRTEHAFTEKVSGGDEIQIHPERGILRKD